MTGQTYSKKSEGGVHERRLYRAIKKLQLTKAPFLYCKATTAYQSALHLLQLSSLSPRTKNTLTAHKKTLKHIAYQKHHFAHKDKCDLRAIKQEWISCLTYRYLFSCKNAAPQPNNKTTSPIEKSQ